tara:strand:+ start:38 stop:400 length:363 start_codon:yes stop_codon:yes gene_type:complete
MNDYQKLFGTYNKEQFALVLITALNVKDYESKYNRICPEEKIEKFTRKIFLDFNIEQSGDSIKLFILATQCFLASDKFDNFIKNNKQNFNKKDFRFTDKHAEQMGEIMNSEVQNFLKFIK